MTQRLSLVIFASAVLGSLVSGCTSMHGHKDETFPVTDDHKPPPDPPGEPVRSPYAAKVGKTDAPRGPTSPAEIRPAGYPAEGAQSGGILPVPEDPTGPGRNRPDWLSPIFPHPLESGKSPSEDPPVVIAMRYLLNQQPREAVRAVERYAKPNQEALLLLLPWVARFAQNDLDQIGPDEVAKFLEQVEDYARKLRPRAELALGKVCFCRDVGGFGMINPLPPGHVFQAGSGGRSGEYMFLYVEVSNFTSQPSGQLYVTRLAGKLEILDGHKQCVWRQVFPAEPNASVSPRHDYFIIFRFAVPADLPPGRYTLAVQLTDQTGLSGKEAPSHRNARQKLAFEIAADDAVRVPGRTPAVGGTTGN